MRNYTTRVVQIVLVVAMFASCMSEKDYLVTIVTPYGDMKAILYDETPLHKENFIKLAKEGFYDSLLFHRVIKDFMIQGGDPTSKNAPTGAPLGSGSPGYQIPAEFRKNLFHEKGALSAARTNNPKKESSGSQFYIVQGKKFTDEEMTNMSETRAYHEKQLKISELLKLEKHADLRNQVMMMQRNQDVQGLQNFMENIDSLIIIEYGELDNYEYSVEQKKIYTEAGGAPHLDGDYTVFGKVIDGLDVIDKIADQPTAQGDRPQEDITMIINVEEVSRKSITKDYGYTYPEQ